MPVLAAPAFLLAGALAALVPLAAHLIRRRPPQRAPFPTARFLAPDPRNAVRVSRPTDLGLLLLRMAVLLLLGAGLARPSWLPAARGLVPVVLLDRSIASADRGAAAAAARTALLPGSGGPTGVLVLFDTAATIVSGPALTTALFDSLASGAGAAPRADLAVGFRAVRPALRTLAGGDSVRLLLVSSFDRNAWSEGFGAVRPLAWPGRVEAVRIAPSSAPTTAPQRERAPVLVSGPGGDRVAAALGAAGYEVRRADRGTPRAGEHGVLLGPVAGVDVHPGGGGTIVVAHPHGEGEAGGDLWFAADLRLAGAGPRAALPRAEGARLVAAWHDGAAAATARPVGAGCIVEVGTALEGGGLALDPGFPAALDRLLRGCEGDSGGGGALDAGAMAVLAGGGPETVAAGSVEPGRSGRPLGRWLLAAALLAAVVETGIAYGSRRRG
jgi:hypothetical protein